jgi:hypothetical protein
MYSCTKCSSGLTNDDKSSCIGENKPIVPQNYTDILKPDQCPDFTIYDVYHRQCNLDSYIHNKLFKSRYVLRGMKEQLEIDCDEETEICYQNFIGPIKGTNGLFFMSLFERDMINITDFTIINEDDDLTKGHIFALMNLEDGMTGKLIKTNKGKNLKNNIKIMKNFGSSIERVYISRVLGNEGLVVNYTNGDICLSDHSQRYSTVLFIICDKGVSHKTPKYLGTLNNNNCTHVFELLSQHGCPSCVKNETYTNYVKYS